MGLLNNHISLNIVKSNIYANTYENRKLGRVGRPYDYLNNVSHTKKEGIIDLKDIPKIIQKLENADLDYNIKLTNLKEDFDSISEQVSLALEEWSDEAVIEKYRNIYSKAIIDYNSKLKLVKKEYHQKVLTIFKRPCKDKFTSLLKKNNKSISEDKVKKVVSDFNDLVGNININWNKFNSTVIDWTKKNFSINSSNKSVPITVQSGIRAYHCKGAGIVVRPCSENYVYIHELGHFIENYVPGLKEKAIAFLNKRTGDKIERKLSTDNKAYQNHEIYKEGQFYDAYVGKIYRSKDNPNVISDTEIISMGLEALYTDPLTFYRTDKEHFEFIIDAINQSQK
jgi:hypothetical protein